MTILMSAVARYWTLAMVAPGDAREAVLGDLAEIGAGAAGWRGVLTEMASSTPALLWMRVAGSAELAVSMVAAVLAALPLAVAERVAAECLSAVPLKAPAERPWWFVTSASLICATLALRAVRARRDEAIPAWWPAALALAGAGAAWMAGWPWEQRAWAGTLMGAAGAVAASRRRWSRA